MCIQYIYILYILYIYTPFIAEHYILFFREFSTPISDSPQAARWLAWASPPNPSQRVRRPKTARNLRRAPNKGLVSRKYNGNTMKKWEMHF